MVNSDHSYQHQQNPYGHPYHNQTNSQQPSSTSLYYASNGNYATGFATGRATPTSDSALVSIDSAEASDSPVLTSNLHAISGSQTVANYNHNQHSHSSKTISNPGNQQRANLFRRFPLRSILKNGKVHNSSEESGCLVNTSNVPPPPLSQHKSGILKKSTPTTTTSEAVITIGNGSIPSTTTVQHNGGNLNLSSNLSSQPPPLPILQVSPSSASSHASAKSAASLVQFSLQPTETQRKENSCDTSSSSTVASATGAAAMSSSSAAAPSVSTVSVAALTSTSAVGRAYAIASAAACASQTPSHLNHQQQPLSVNRLQVPPNPNHPTPSPSLSIVRPSSAVTSHLTHHPSLAAIGPSSSLSGAGASVVASNGSLQPAYYTATTSQRMSDLRRILNPEVEKEDSFKKFTEAIENCDCFEFNLNNAAKLITVLVLLATLVLVIRALKGDSF